VTAAISVSGLGGGGFTFLGFLPRTPGKIVRLVGDALGAGRVLAFLESPFRLARTLTTLAPLLGAREVVVARELTKRHESLHIGTAEELAALFTATPPRGECTVLVGGSDVGSNAA